METDVEGLPGNIPRVKMAKIRFRISRTSKNSSGEAAAYTIRNEQNLRWLERVF